MKKLAFIHCIENKHQRMYERQSWLFTETFKQTNRDIYNNSNHYFLQPTAVDIAPQTINYFQQNDVNFNKVLDLEQKQVNSEINYTNMCIAAEYYSRTLDEEYMCWSDTDVLWLNKTDSGNFFKETTTPVINSFPLRSMPRKSYAMHEFGAFDIGCQLDQVYQNHLKEHLSDEFRVEELTHYVNTWFIYAPTKHKFWSEWKQLTFRLLDIVQAQSQVEIEYHIESFCEEIAASIMYCKAPEEFTLSEDFFGDIFVMRDTGNDKYDIFTENKVLYHYTGLLNKPYEIIDDTANASTIVMKFLTEASKIGHFHYDSTMMMKLFKNYVGKSRGEK